jgi:DNA-directed RNA polymerase specialized sigma subunit
MGDSVMGSYVKYRDEELKNNPKLKAEYDALEPEYDIIQAMIDTRKSQNMTQKELSERTGITQADISRSKMELEIPVLKCSNGLSEGWEWC